MEQIAFQPSRKCTAGGIAKAAVLMHPLRRPLPQLAEGVPTRFGRYKPRAAGVRCVGRDRDIERQAALQGGDAAELPVSQGPCEECLWIRGKNGSS